MIVAVRSELHITRAMFVPGWPFQCDQTTEQRQQDEILTGRYRVICNIPFDLQQSLRQDVPLRKLLQDWGDIRR